MRSGASSAKGGAPPAQRATASRGTGAAAPQLGSGAARRGDDADDEGSDGAPVADL